MGESSRGTQSLDERAPITQSSGNSLLPTTSLSDDTAHTFQSANAIKTADPEIYTVPKKVFQAEVDSPLPISQVRDVAMVFRRPVAKERFSTVFGSAKTQAYQEAPSRGPGINNTIRTIAWNPTGSLIATGSVNKTIRIWNPERPNIKYSTELRGHTSGIEKVLFNPVREAEVASCSADGTVRLWDARSKNCTSVITVGGEPFTLAWSGDGSVLLCGRRVRQDFRFLSVARI